MTLAPGTKLGPYEIVSPLGAGGMGEVYRARDTRLDREVALKVLPVGALGDEAAQARLITEAKTASSLNHPHICTIYDVGESAHQTYVAMEYVEGRPLSQLVPHDGLPLELVLRYGEQIAAGLAYAHEHGVVHRDLKTANVMITPDGRAKVLDFGLARRLQGDEMAEATLSKTSHDAPEIAGTLPYMAPEVLRGEAADARSDIWALGVVLYEMAAGQLPFTGKTTYDLTSAILREPLPPLPARVPAGLRSVIQRCMAKEPGQRYPRIGEVRSALEAIGSSDTLAVGVPPAGRVTPWRRSRIVAMAGAVFVVAFLAFMLRGRLASSGRKPSKQIEVAKTTGPRTSTGAPASSNAEATGYYERAILFELSRYQPEQARQLLSRALELDPHFAEARAWYGSTFWQVVDSGSSNDSAMVYKAEEEARRALQDDPNCPRAHYLLAWIYLYRGRKAEAKAEGQLAMQLNPEDTDAENLLANIQVSSGELEAARRLEEKSLARQPASWNIMMNLGWILSEQGDQAAAIHEWEQGLEGDPGNVYMPVCLGHAHLLTGDVNLARKRLEKANPEVRGNYWVRIIWALVLASEGKRSAAHKEMDAEVQKYGTLNPFATLWVAEFYAVLGEKEKALEWLDQAVKGGDENAEWFARDPLLASIHNEPHFKQILDSVAFHRQQRQAAQSKP